MYEQGVLLHDLMHNTQIPVDMHAVVSQVSDNLQALLLFNHILYIEQQLVVGLAVLLLVTMKSTDVLNLRRVNIMSQRPSWGHTIQESYCAQGHDVSHRVMMCHTGS